MAAKELYFSVEARAALKRGVDKLAEAVKVTFTILWSSPFRYCNRRVMYVTRSETRRWRVCVCVATSQAAINTTVSITHTHNSDLHTRRP